MSKTADKAAKAALIVSLLTLGSKVFGFFREILIAAKFGSGMETDTFFVAMTATALISNFFTTTISTTFVPVLAEIEKKEGKVGKFKHTSNLVNHVLALASVIIIVFYFFAPQLVRFVARGFVGEQFDFAVKLTRIGLPMLLISGAIGAFSGYLHSERRHYSTAALGFPLNIVQILYLFLFSDKFGIVGLMIAALMGTATQLLIQVPEIIRSGFFYSPTFDHRDIYLRQILRLSLPVIISVAIADLNAVVDRTMASSLVSGSISALTYGSRLSTMVQSVFITAITTVIFPVLAQNVSQGNINQMKKVMGEGINLILLITIPATVGIAVLAQPIVEIAFERGEFSAVGTQMTKHALLFYSPGLVASSIYQLITRVFYSLHDTKTPVFIAVLSFLINFGLNLLLVKYMAHAGLAFATSIANTLAAVFLFYALRKRIGPLGTLGYIRVALKAILASVLMGVIAYVVYYGLYTILGVSKFHNLISLMVAVVAGAVVYVMLCYLMKLDQARGLVNKLRNRLNRPAP